MKRTLEATAAVALVMVGGIDIAAAQQARPPLCRERAELLKHLEQRHGETPQALGLSADGGVLEVLVSPEGGWTILVTHPNQPTCVVAVGQAWQAVVAGERA